MSGYSFMYKATIRQQMNEKYYNYDISPTILKLASGYIMKILGTWGTLYISI